jgi:adenine/guanine/hypoxanthine permease
LPDRGFLDRRFSVRARGSTIPREVIGGLTTFAAMAYCVAVNPMVMQDAGMDRASVLSATCLIAIICTTIMGLWANLPLGLAPAMGSNVVFAVVLVRQMGMPWPAALALVSLTGGIFLVMTMTGLRERIAHAIPLSLRVGIQGAVGFVILFIGMRHAGFVVPNRSTFVAMGPIDDPRVLLTLAGFIATPVLVARRVPGALILSIAVLTIAGLFLPDGHGGTITRWPTRIVALPIWPRATAFHQDWPWLAQHVVSIMPMMFFFLCTELFGSLANVLSAMSAAGLVAENGHIPHARRTFATDAIGSMAGPLLGTSVVTVYSESVTGVQAGARTGLAALVIAGGFCLALFFWPIFMIIPAQATAPALLVVGLMMLQGLRALDLSDLAECGPALLTIVIAAMTANLINGMAFGVFAHIAMMSAHGRAREMSPVIWALGVIFGLFFLVSAGLHPHGH